MQKRRNGNPVIFPNTWQQSRLEQFLNGKRTKKYHLEVAKETKCEKTEQKTNSHKNANVKLRNQ